MCYKMYCFDPVKGICITASEQRAAMGTSCGDKKVWTRGIYIAYKCNDTDNKLQY